MSVKLFRKGFLLLKKEIFLNEWAPSTILDNFEIISKFSLISNILIDISRELIFDAFQRDAIIPKPHLVKKMNVHYTETRQHTV